MANTNNITGVFNLPTQVIASSVETLVATASMPPNANVDSHSFRVRLVGKATGGTGALLTLSYRLATLTGTVVALFTATTVAVPVAGSNFSVYTDYTWDSVSQTLTGVTGGQTCGMINTSVVNAAGTAIASAAGLSFAATAKFATALATQSITVEELSIEAI